ncbi:hypothetical protein, partial [Streptomyces phaeochromogenes]
MEKAGSREAYGSAGDPSETAPGAPRVPQQQTRAAGEGRERAGGRGGRVGGPRAAAGPGARAG